MKTPPMTEKEKAFRLWAAHAAVKYRQAKRNGDTFVKGIEWGKYCAYRSCALSLGLDRGDHGRYI